MNYKKLLGTIYADNIIKYKITHMRPHPASLLALLLLADINNYEEPSTNIDAFYKSNKEKILKQIKKVIQDFNFTEEALLLYINNNPIINDDNTIFIQVFSSAINTLYYACNNKTENPINIYNNFTIYWGCDHILEAYLQGNFSNEPRLEDILRKRKRTKG